MYIVKTLYAKYNIIAKAHSEYELDIWITIRLVTTIHGDLRPRSRKRNFPS